MTLTDLGLAPVVTFAALTAATASLARISLRSLMMSDAETEAFSGGGADDLFTRDTLVN